MTTPRYPSGSLPQPGHPFLGAYNNSTYYVHLSFLKKTHLLQNSWIGCSFFGRNFPGGAKLQLLQALPLHQPGISSSSHFSAAWKSPRPWSHHTVMTSPSKNHQASAQKSPLGSALKLISLSKLLGSTTEFSHYAW